MVILKELADMVGGVVVGAAGSDRTEITGTASISRFSAGKICYASNARYLEDIRRLDQAVVVVSDSLAELAVDSVATLVVVRDQIDAFFKIHNFFCSEAIRDNVIELSPALMDPTARVHSTAHVGDGSVVEAGVELGPNVCVMENVRIGQGTVIHPGAVIYPNTEIGDDCLVHAGAVIGADGFRFQQWPDRERIVKLIHAGYVSIGDRVEIGANSTVDRATFEGDATSIDNDVKLDDQVHIGHNARVGARTTVAAQSCLSGSVILEEDVWVGAAATISQGVTVGSGAKVLINAVVVKDVGPGSVVSGFYAMPHAAWKRAFARFARAK